MISATITDDLNTSSADQFAPLVNAAKTIDEFVERDSKYPDLADLLKGPTSGQYEKRVSTFEQCFVQSNRLDIPEQLAARLNQLECRCFMGIMPEIERVWMTVDHRLHLWNYKDGSDVCTFEDQDQIICSIALVPPKQNVFGDHINYVLVLATPISISIVGVSAEKKSALGGVDGMASEKIEFYVTDIAVPSDGIQVMHITGTDKGRIFLLGGDGRLYELEYNHPDHWLQRRCYLVPRTSSPFRKFLPTFFQTAHDAQIKSIAMDNERNTLYLYRDNSSIEVIYLGANGDSFTSVTTHQDIQKSALTACRQTSMVFDAQDFEIESIHVIPKAESKKIHLVAVTTTGFRLYFTHHKDALRITTIVSDDTPPNCLELVHVRLPPTAEATGTGNTLQDQHNQASAVQFSFYHYGVLWTAKSTGQNNEILLMTCADISDRQDQPTNTFSMTQTSSKSSFVETCSVVDNGTKVWAIVEKNGRGKQRPFQIEMTEAITDPPRQFLVLTSNGLSLFNKQRPVDLLQQLLTASRGNIETHQSEFLQFFERYGSTQGCAMCLAIICANFGASNPEQLAIARGAMELYFNYGGSPKASSSTTPAGNYLGRAIGATGTIYSGKHDGLALYFSRLVSKVWKTKIFDSSMAEQKGKSKLQEDLFVAQQNLIRLKNFMDTNPDFHFTTNFASAQSQSMDHAMVQVMMSEQQSFQGLYILLKHCIEAIAFLDFLIDANIVELLKCVPESIKAETTQLNLETILATQRGRILARELVIAAINVYSGSYTHAGFDVVSNLLQNNCSTFFGPKDVAFYRGVENLRRAHQAESEFERTHRLSESLRLFKEAADYLMDEKLAEICAEYTRQGYHIGCIELPLERAQKIDPREQALSYMNDRCPPGDQRAQLYQGRVVCYNHVFDALLQVKKLEDAPQESQHPRISDPVLYYKQVFTEALSSKDQLFHFMLYQWLIQNDMIADLLGIDSAYLVPFFKNYVSETDGMNFLWQYYRRREQYYEAALYLDALATQHSDINLAKRIEYLSLAIVNARCRDPNRVHVQESIQLLQTLEDRIAVARIQYRLQQTLQNGDEQSKQAAARLDGKLLSLNELFRDYAQRFNVHEEILHITRMANHSNPVYMHGLE